MMIVLRSQSLLLLLSVWLGRLFFSSGSSRFFSDPFVFVNRQPHHHATSQSTTVAVPTVTTAPLSPFAFSSSASSSSSAEKISPLFAKVPPKRVSRGRRSNNDGGDDNSNQKRGGGQRGGGSDKVQQPTRSSEKKKSVASATTAAATTSTTRPPLSPSKVVDPDGPTLEGFAGDVEEVDPETDVPELRDIRHDDDLPRPVDYQPWRRGDTAGCEAPIAVEWRQDAEQLITKAANFMGYDIFDVTWFLTAVVVTLDPSNLYHTEGRIPDITKSSGPVIDILERQRANYKDPTDPKPADIDHLGSTSSTTEILYQRQTEEEAEKAQLRKSMSFAKKDGDDDPTEPHVPLEAADPEVGLYMNEETRQDIALRMAEEELERYEAQEKPINVDTLVMDTAAISTIAEAILQALEEREDELHILSRHELILTSPGAPDVLDTQKQFDAFRGADIIVETQDPFDSNRTLKGKLVDRNSMDLILNKKGRLVTIPLNFVKCVRLPPAKREKAVTL